MKKKIRKNDILNLYNRLFKYIVPYWRRLLVGALLALVISATKGGTAWAVKPALDEIFLKKDVSKLIFLPIGIILLYLVQGVARYIQNYFMKYVAQKVMMEIRNDLYFHINRMSVGFFHKTHSSILMSRITNDVRGLSKVASDVIPDFLIQTFTFIALIGVVFYQEWRLAIIAVLILPFVVMLIVKIGGKLKKISRKTLENAAVINTVLQESFIGVKIVKAFGMEEYENRRFEKVNRRSFDLSMKAVKTDELTSPLMEFLGAIAGAIILWYGGYQVIKGISTPGTFFSFLAALAMLYEPLKKFGNMSNDIHQAMAAAERVFELLDQKPDISDAANAVELKDFKDRIEFKDVWFAYNSEKEMVLKNINLEINKGEMIAIVGMSGVGKSTLVDLIPRFYQVSRGELKIDEYDINKLTLKSLRSKIGIVTQDIFLFNDTVKDNIAYGRINADEDKIIDAANKAYAHQFIMEMPDKYETIIGERGVRLSGGEKQRIAIARALLKDAPILILDEATSALDSESEMMVQKALENLMRDRTTFVIAHRLSTVRKADKIIILDDGRIAESGKHEELVSRNGIYRKLHDMQFKEENVY
ncbi:MAG: lipid A export permease/ATP-binding protein MsbA [Candidatus Schekmanbacteria bacterium RIFCSPHIGHO2_02_FULL_38_11]|uniref:Lipid A export permease/ATP-binding protein MsbA n=1 Tax=Candidatus Schekmanbacteria bacterium RIFCSPLOWO2_12_FULL_38_15 TaxID=1817883 RepID=A0A1F7SF09_9BACT|nr:MAG: lipid A export permease/ATP-binding protein MsbA [Candidatus Schekmanbacteria bacterium GWA2_38_9]OGL49574.1 MAG: lipid A export permease/ATP-binding protein MsbA [Candidatus Schekmanbacteria bacterium RIFCSPHIGHO2_02_FULL_38_11]OGL51484.1 MAG: lipid A export permease/ATP-binding protein MsbA [Candidatus Schekmanbacteria bacterium RIFCSPLOWO2_02_FULL_38_14]OGL51834.1 MAG: lipid A export permease/ATP-binding protein MsbA [Candidatus Schekmanbacteria bacterium RIFCSPLOWO2_12_FULL_38_15]